MTPTIHPALDTYLRNNALLDGPSREDGAIELVLDEVYRVLCFAGPRGTLVFESVLCALPNDMAMTDDLLVRALRMGFQRLHEGRESACISEDERELVLKQHITADADIAAFEQALEDFTNALVEWRRQLRIL